MMMVLWNPNSLTSLANFSFPLNILKTCPWSYATFIILSFFVLIISSYRLIMLLQEFAFFRLHCLDCQILQFHLWSSNPIISFLSLLSINVSPFYYLLNLSTSINKNMHFNTRFKTKMLIQTNFLLLNL